MTIVIGDISNTLAIASLFSKKLEIPFWEFEIAAGFRRAISYPALDPEIERSRLTRILFDQGKETEQYYASATRLSKTLLILAKAATSDEMLKRVIDNLPSFYVQAGDIAWEKWKARHEPEKLERHRQLMRAHNAAQLGKISVCKTVEEARVIAFAHNSATYPIYDSHRDKALLKMVSLAEDMETLRDVNKEALVWHRAKFAALRKMFRLPSGRWPS